MLEKKWVVMIIAEDDIFKRNHSSLGGAVTYFSNQLGRKVDVSEVEEALKRQRIYKEVDQYGRVLELIYGDVGVCEVCKSRNELLGRVRLSPDWHRIPKEHIVRACIGCMNDHEMGRWLVEHKAGKTKVSKV